MKKAVIIGISFVLLIGIAGVAIAEVGHNTETLAPMTYEFDYWQPGGYSGWGPALYYGQDVQVHYVATNRWTMTRKDLGDGTYWVRQSLTQIGTAVSNHLTP